MREHHGDVYDTRRHNDEHDARDRDQPHRDQPHRDQPHRDPRARDHPDRPHRLRLGIGELLRSRRGAAGLSQDHLARDAGVTQPLVSRVERGITVPSLDLVERLFAALGLQLRVAAEPLDADLDAELDRISLVPLEDRLINSDWPYLVSRLGELPYVIEGGLAALVQGAPVAVRVADIAVAVRDVDAFDTWLRLRGAQRWNERWQEFGYGNPDPRLEGPLRWQVCLCELRARICRELPESVEVRIQETVYRVRPLLQLELTDPLVAGLVRRYLVRSGALDAASARGRG
ncbi:MAG: helix-turn-helix domain-containing protein [Micromonosporaceae bacterium]